MTDRPTQWSPCGLQSRSVELPCACVIYYDFFSFYVGLADKPAVYTDKDGTFTLFVAFYLFVVFYFFAEAKTAVAREVVSQPGRLVTGPTYSRKIQDLTVK